MPNNKKGFTLIELLVVMGILGILMAVTILVINPAEYLRRTRDTQRINDIQTVNSAIAMAVANEDYVATEAVCYATIAGTPARVCNAGASVAPTVGDRTVAGTTGWVRNVNLAASFGTLPIDPSSSAAKYFYLFSSSATDYELNVATFESQYYTVTNKVAENDGGELNTACVADTYVKGCMYEVGSLLTLIKASP